MFESVAFSFTLPYTTDPTSLHLPDIPDVLCHVYSYRGPINYFCEQIHESRRSLVMAARPCWRFSGPALDVLWKPLADLFCALGIAS